MGLCLAPGRRAHLLAWALAACALSLPAWADPNNPLLLSQANGDTGGLDGGVTSEGREILLTASSSSSSCFYSPYHLEFEVRPTTSSFTGAVTHYSATINKTCVQQQFPWTHVTGLLENTAYKWRVREVAYYGGASSWVAFNGGATAFTTGPLPANHLAFTTGTLSPIAGNCAGPSTVQLQDALNGPVPVASTSSVPVFQSSDVFPPQVGFYSDANCDAGISASSMPAGGSTASFYWKTTKSGTVTVGADVSGGLWALQSHTVAAGSPTKLVFVNPNYGEYLNVCSNPRTVQLQDVYGNPALATAATTVTLGSSVGTTQLYPAAGCATAPVGSVTIPVGASQVSFYFKESTLGPKTVTATTGTYPAVAETSYTYGRTNILPPVQTRDAGQCSLLTTLQTQDGNGAAYLGPAGININLTGSPGMSFYSESTCDAGISYITTDGGTSDLNFYWRSTMATSPYNQWGYSTYFYGYGGYYSNNYAQYPTINPGPPYQLGFGNGSQTIVAGACSPQQSARSLDVYGNFSPAPSNIVVGLASTSDAGTFYTDSLCTPANRITSVTIAPPTLLQPFYWKDTTPGSPTLTLTSTAPALVTATQVETVIPKLVFTSAAQNLVAGTCATATVQSQDGLGLPWNTPTTKSINLSTNSPAGPFYADTDTTCTGATVNFISMPAGTNTITFHWRDTKAGTHTITASASGYASGSQAQVIRADVPAQMVFTTAPQAVGAGSCSSTTTVEQEDTYGNAATQATARTVNLSSTSATTRFYPNSACTMGTEISSASIASGLSPASFFWKDTTAPQTPTLTATSTGLLDGTQVETVSVGAATQLSITSAAKTVTAGACSGSATVTSQDASGNASNLSTATSVSLSSSGTAVFYAGAGCAGAPVTAVQISAATNSAIFSWVETAAGPLTITPGATGFTGNGQVQTVTPATATQLAFTSAAQSIPAGSCSAATTVTLTDQYGNATPAAAAIPVALTTTSTTMGLYSDACTTPATAVTIGAGASSVNFYFRDIFTGTPTLTATASGLIPDSQTESIGGRDQVTYRWYSSAGAALGAEGAPIQAAPGTQLHLRLGVKAVAFAWKLASGDAVPISETLANAGTHTGSYLNVGAADGSSETLTETRIGNGQNRYWSLGNTAAGGWPFHIYSFNSLPVGKTSYPLCLTARTTGEALKVGYTFTSTPNLTPTFPAGWQITSVSLTEVCFDLKAQSFNGGPLTVYLQDALRGAGTDNTTDTFTLDQVTVRGDPPTYLALERSSSSTFTTVTQVLSGELWDDTLYANGASVAALLTGTTANEVRVESRPNIPTSQVDVNPGGQGEWDFTLTFPASGGSQYYRMVVTNSLGTKLSNLEVTSVPAQVDTAATQLAFTTSALNVAAGTCAGQLKVQAQDPAGNARVQTSARTITLSSSPTAGAFYTNATCTGPTTTTVTIPAGSADAAFYWRETVAGTPTLTAATAGLTSATQTETVTAGPPASVIFTSAPQNVTVGACSAAATVQVRDAFGNPSPAGGGGVSGTLSSTSGTTFHSDNTCTAGNQISSLTVAPGSTTATFYFKDTVAGTATISWTTPLGVASQLETFSVGVPTKLAIISAGFTLTAGNCSSGVQAGGVVVQAQDSFSNPANVTTNIVVALASDSPTTVFFSDNLCSAVNQITTRTIVQPANTAAFYWKDTTARAVNVTVTAAGLTAGTLGYTVVPAAAAKLALPSAPQTVVAGACSSPVTVNVQDTYGNSTSTGASTNLPLASSDAPAMTFFSNACTTGITFLALNPTDQTKQLWFRDTRAGNPVVTVSGPGLTPVNQTETIVPAPTAGLTMSVTTPITAGAATPFTVSAVDPFFNVAQDYAGSVQFNTSDPRATLPPATSFTPGTGSQNFNATFLTAGTQSLTVVDNGVPPLSSTLGGLVVRAAAAATLQVSGVPSPVTSGSAHDVTVNAADPYGNTAIAYTGTVRFTSTDATGTMPANYAFVAGDQGRHTFLGGVTLRAPGSHTVTATDTVTGTVTGQQSGIVVLQAQGGPCTGDGECSTGYCVGSVCCDTSCAGACNSCTLANRVGTCSVVADGTVCANSLYCDGVETCQGGFCAPGVPVACLDPEGYEQLACDERTQSCVLVPNAPPSIVHDASPRGATGLPYAYNAFGRVTGLGARPMTFGTCAPLPGFQVDRASGAVTWTPSATGTYTACVSAQNSGGTDQYTFAVNVTAPSGSPPMAAFTIIPDTGEAPLIAAFDGSASTGDPSALPLLWRWDFGDFSPLASGARVSNQYLVAGGYQAELTALDAAGRPGTVKQPLWVLDKGRRPPVARILSPRLTGDVSLSTSFSCDCTVGDAALRGFFWELGDLATADTSSVTQAFPPGRYRVRLTVVDGNGLTATDSVQVVVTNGLLQPPDCREGLSPPAGPAPLTVWHHATFGDQDGTIAYTAMTYSNGQTGLQADEQRTYDTPGRYRSTLKATDDNGLTCVDLVEVAVLGQNGRPPPGFLSAPAAAGTCGIAYQYSALGRPLVSGNGPIRFSLVPVAGGAVPNGMNVDPDTGAILWTPSSKNTGANHVVLRATSADGTADQPLDVTVTCADQQNLSLGCTCSQAGGASWVAIGLGLMLLARFRRRREAARPGYSPTLARRRRLPR